MKVLLRWTLAINTINTITLSSTVQYCPALVSSPGFADWHNSKKLKDAAPSPENLRFYPATWKDCLEDAKKECQAAHMLDNPFPTKACDLNVRIRTPRDHDG